jgi:hypothetical protein
MQVAQTILGQLGGNKFVAMTGAKQFVGMEDGLMFAVPKTLCVNKANKVRVTLLPSDTYRVEFFAIRGVNVKTISEHDGVYAEDLRRVFEDETGMRTSL